MPYVLATSITFDLSVMRNSAIASSISAVMAISCVLRSRDVSCLPSSFWLAPHFQPALLLQLMYDGVSGVSSERQTVDF
jgi:hypothetical protein